MAKRKSKTADEPTCIVCGCTQNNACDGGCEWIAADLCSACEEAWTEAVGTLRKLYRAGTLTKKTILVAQACRRMRDRAYEELGAP